jgi:hypothetical protein
MSNEMKGWYIQLDTGVYQKASQPESVVANIDGGVLSISDSKKLKGAISASITLPLYPNKLGEEGVGKSISMRRAAMDLITAVKNEVKFEGDLDVRVDTWIDEKDKSIKNALKYVIYNKKKS